MMTSLLAVVGLVAIVSVNGQWNNRGAWNSGQWNGGQWNNQQWNGGRWNNLGRGMIPGFQQINTNEPTEVNCHSDFAGNKLEVTIRPQQSFFFNGASPYAIEVKVTSFDIDGDFTVAVTDLSTDNPVCMESELGFIASNGQSQNSGLLALLSRQMGRQQSEGVLGEIKIKSADEATETFTMNSLYRNFREFRGLGVGLCTSTTDLDNSTPLNPFNPVQRNSRQLCEYPVLCCKLGLANSANKD